ncbi:MAG: amidohydrolase family protein, partial [Planctomycetes bacterium]|nr:amidohydrolase family protein [Planctomycetota bacterium]
GVAALRAAGVTLAFGSFGREPGKLLDDLRVARAKGGLSAEDALAGFTSGAAAIFGGRTPPGELAAGAPALLTAWDGEPLAKDVPVRLLVVDGVLFDLRGQVDDDASKDEDEESQPAAPAGDGEDAPPDGEPAAASPDAARVEWPVELDADREPSFRTGGDVLVANATLHTASHGTLTDHDLLVRGGRIEAIGRDLLAPEGVRVVDATGRHVIPGIIDCHSHTGIRGGVNEWTRGVTPEVSIEDEVDPDDVDIWRALAGGVTSMRLLHGSANAIGGRHEVVKLRWGRSAPEMLFEGAPRGVKFALGENPRQANSGGSGRFPATRMGVEAVIRRSLEAGAEYRAAWDEWEAHRAAGEDPDPLRRDLRLEALAGILSGEIRVHSHCYQSDEMLMLIRTCEEFGIRIATLQHVLEGYKVAAEIAAHGAGGSTFVDWWGFKFEVYDATPYAAALMTEAGVLMSVNSDSAEHLRRLHLEAAKTVRYGGTPEEQALRMATLNPAIQLGVGERTGSLDVGKDADFAVFSAHPFDVATRCLMTFVDGELYFERREGTYDAWEAELQRRLAEARAARKEPGDA